MSKLRAMWYKGSLGAAILILMVAMVTSLARSAPVSGHSAVTALSQSADLLAETQLTASIIIQAYTADGTLLRSDDFMKATTGEVFATGPDDLPHYAVYKPTYDSIPSFAVMPQRPYKIYAVWEIPEFGKVMLSADNEAKGYLVGKEGASITLNFNYELAKSKLSALRKDSDKFMSQGFGVSPKVADGLSLGAQHLKTAEDRLRQGGNPDMAAVTKELNLSLKSSLPAHEQLLLDQAKADIEKYRKGNVTVKVVDKEGKPFSNVNISFKQITNDFIFSATPVDSGSSNLVKDAGINHATAYFKYGAIEPQPGKYDWKIAGQVDSQLRSGFRSIGNLGWFFSSGWENRRDIYFPTYLDGMTFEDVRKTVYNHVYAAVERYKDKVNIWNAIYEECATYSNGLMWTWDQKFEVLKTAASAVKDANPKAMVLATDTALPHNRFMSSSVHEPVKLDAVARSIPYPEFISVAGTRQIPIDIIGLQLPTGTVEIYQSGSPNIHPLLDVASISAVLDQYSRFGKLLYVTDFQAPSTQIAGGNWWHRPWDEETQAEYTSSVYTVVFSKPLAKGIDWGTGIADDVAGQFGGLTSGLLSADLKPKPSYFALKDLISSWTTKGSGKTDSKGELMIRGFAGDYELTLKTTDGQSFSKLVHVDEQQTSEATIEFPFATQKELQTTITPTNEEMPFSEKPNIWPIAGTIGGLLIMASIVLFVIRKSAHKINI